MLIMTTTTTVTIPPAPPRSPPPPSLQMPTRRRACHNVTATKCHRNCFSTAGGAGYGIGGGIGDDNETMAMTATVTGEQTPPTKRNWVLSDNFYLLESPKTWRDKQRTRTANRRQYFQCNGGGGGGGLSDTVDNVNCDEKLLSRIASDHQMKRRYCQQLQTATSINCHGLNRSLRNLLDYREEEAEKTSESTTDEVMKCSIELKQPVAEKGGLSSSQSRNEPKIAQIVGRDAEKGATEKGNSGNPSVGPSAPSIAMTTVDGSVNQQQQHLLRKSSSAAVVVPSSSGTSNAMDCSWLSSSAGSAGGGGGVGGSGFLSSGLMLENSSSATEIGGGRISTGSPAISSDIRQHLQSMFHVLRPEETLKMAVKLESARAGRTRYLVVVSRSIRQRLMSQCFNVGSSNAPEESITEESDDSKDSGRLSQDELVEGKVSSEQMMTETSDRANNGGGDAEGDGVPPMDGEVVNGTADLERRMSTDCGSFDAAGTEEDQEESCLLGIDCNEQSTVGLVLRIYADTKIHLDGDGGFSVSVCGRTHIFKPVSVQAMWSALQTLHKVSSKARENNYFEGGPSHLWTEYYEDHIGSDQSCINEWFAMDSLESRRPPSPDTIRNKPTAREETEVVIRTALKEIIMSVDLDEVTSKYIRGRLEEHLDMDLGEYKSFIDEEMLVILGQMDVPTEIFDHVYLGSEWNASNLEELQRNGVGHILNVTREIDNFFPGLFDYFNIRVYDEETTDLLKYWDNTFKYITKARQAGSKVLVHCKMGVSRSASVVIAYAMKSNNWDFKRALQHVKEKRNCIKPNKGFTAQLETYQGILAAMRNKEKLQRSKSETNLKSSAKDARLLPGSEPTPLIQALNGKQRSVYSTYRRYQSVSLKGIGRDHYKRASEKRQAAYDGVEVTEKSTVEDDDISVKSSDVSDTFHEKPQSLTEFLRQNEVAQVEKEAVTAADVDEKQRQLESNRKFMKNLNIIVRGKKEQQRKYIRNAEREESLKTRPRSWSQQLGNIDGLRVGAFPMAPVRQLSQSLENLLVSGGSAQREFNSSSSSGNNSSGNNSDTSSTNAEGRSKKDSKWRRERTRWRFSKTTKTVRLPCSNGQNYSVSQNKIVHLTPESNNSSFLSHFSGSPEKATAAGDRDDEVELRRNMVSSVRLIVNEIESSNNNPVVVTGTGTLGRGQRDKKAMSLNLSKEERERSANKLILKCDSSPVISLQLREGEELKRPTVIAISKTGAVSIESGGTSSSRTAEDASSSEKKMRLDQPDTFSKTVDRVFEREEKKQARNSVLLQQQPLQLGATTTTTMMTLSSTPGQKDCLISRQSSWSSVDSACVMGGYPSESNLRDLPSRHSSWGSGDTSRTTPSRNSSWGSYDMRSNPLNLPKTATSTSCPEEEPPQHQDDVPWHPGTVRRTKQKIEEREKGGGKASAGQSSVKLRNWGGQSQSAANSSTLLIVNDQSQLGVPKSSSSSRCMSEEALQVAKSKRNTICGGALLICPPGYSEQLSVSAPSSSTSNSSCCSTYTAVNLRGGCCRDGEDGDHQEEVMDLITGDELGPPATVAGMVQNLKMNFELNGGSTLLQAVAGDDQPVITSRSLPSSPVAVHNVAKSPFSTSSSEEEEHQQQQQQRLLRVEKKNVKNLVGRYETTKVQLRASEARKTHQQQPRQRPKSQIIPERKPMAGGGPFSGSSSVTMPNSPAQRKSGPFNFNVAQTATAFARPLMITHNKIKGGMSSIYGESKASAAAAAKGTSPRPPPSPQTGGSSAGQKTVLGNKINVNIQEGKAMGGGGGGGLKKSPGQQQGKTHPLTKLSFAFRQH